MSLRVNTEINTLKLFIPCIIVKYKFKKHQLLILTYCMEQSPS